MPKKGKGRGVAARQAQLRNRKNRSKVVRHQNFDAGPSAKVSSATEPDVGTTVAIVSEQEKDKTISVQRGSAHSRNRRNVKSTKEVALTYDYLGIEIRRIGILTVLIGVVIAVMTVLLG